MLLGILGTVITDNVLTLGCWRGVVISGGIVPKLAPLIAHSPFAEDAENGIDAHLIEMIPVWMSVDPYAVCVAQKWRWAMPIWHRALLTPPSRSLAFHRIENVVTGTKRMIIDFASG